MNIDGVKNGIVLDHIKAGESMKIYTLLGLEKLDCPVAIIQNVESLKYGKKDIIKIDTELEMDLEALGYIDSNITVNIVKDGKLFGSVSTVKICELMQKQYNIALDKRKFIDKENITSLGTYDLKIELFKDVIATVKVKVTN